MIVAELSDNRGVMYTTITDQGNIMIPIGLRILKTLYKAKKKIGKGSAVVADKVGKAGFTGTSQAITGASKKVHQGTRFVGKKIKKNPKASSFLGGAIGMSFLDD